MSPFRCARGRNRPWNGWLFQTGIRDTRDIPCSPRHVWNRESSGFIEVYFQLIVDFLWSMTGRFSCVCAGVCECQQGDVLAEGVLDGSWKCYSYIYSRGKYVMRLQWIKYSAQILMYLYATSIFFYSTTSQREMLHFQPHQLSQELTTLTTSCFTKISTHKIYEELLKYGDLL